MILAAPAPEMVPTGPDLACTVDVNMRACPDHARERYRACSTLPLMSRDLSASEVTDLEELERKAAHYDKDARRRPWGAA